MDCYMDSMVENSQFTMHNDIFSYFYIACIVVYGFIYSVDDLAFVAVAGCYITSLITYCISFCAF